MKNLILGVLFICLVNQAQADIIPLEEENPKPATYRATLFCHYYLRDIDGELWNIRDIYGFLHGERRCNINTTHERSHTDG